MKAIEEITLLSGQKYLGFVIEEDKEIVNIIDQFNSEIKINKQSISIRQKMFAEVVTRFGAKYTATLRTVEDDYLEFSDDKGSEIRIPKTDLDYIIVNNIKLTPDNWRVLSGFDLPNSITKLKFSAFGLTIGLPAEINFNYIMDYSQNIGFKLSGGYSGDYYGFQANLLYNLKKTPSTVTNLYIGAGYTYIDTLTKLTSNRRVKKEFPYLTGGIDVNFYGFYFDLGLYICEGYLKSPQVIGAIGYIYRFKD